MRKSRRKKFNEYVDGLLSGLWLTLVERMSDQLLFPSTWPSVSKGVDPKETIYFMSRQEPKHFLLSLLEHFSGKVLQFVHDCSVYWARSVHATFDDLEVIGRWGIGKKKEKEKKMR